jgi:deoxyribonuclease V
MGMDASAAAQAVRRMHGPSRLPTLLQRVDRLCRDS